MEPNLTGRARVEAWFFAPPDGNKGSAHDLIKVLGIKRNAVFDAIFVLLRDELIVPLYREPLPPGCGGVGRLVYGPNPKKLGKHVPTVSYREPVVPNVPLVRKALAAQHPLFYVSAGRAPRGAWT